MAGRLLLLAWTALAGVGCLLPQDDQNLPDKPDSKNRRPRLIQETAAPQQKKELPLGDNCPPPDFKIYVEDPDVDDKITSLWFIDPGPQYDTDPFGGKLVASSGSVIRNDPVQPQNPKFLRDFLFANPGWHVVEVVATDGSFTNDGISLVPQTKNGFPNPNYVDSYSWFVGSSKDACPTP